MKLDFDAFVRARANQAGAHDDDALGEEIFAAISEEAVVETTGFAPELVERVSARIQANDAPAERKVPVVYWANTRRAFTLPGRRIYFTRRLLEEQMSEDAVAFAFAHELGHHRLGHLQTVLPALRSMREYSGAKLVSFLALTANRLLMSRWNEAAADAWALERCIEVGYDANACLGIFDALRRIAEDLGDLDIAFGPDEEAPALGESASEGENEGDAKPAWQRTLGNLGKRAGRTAFELVRGYPSLHDRRAALEPRAREAMAERARSTPR